VIPANQVSRFTPIMTLGQGMSWIHGRRVGTRVAAAKVSGARVVKAQASR
jgi:hypothetical protein